MERVSAGDIIRYEEQVTAFCYGDQFEPLDVPDGTILDLGGFQIEDETGAGPCELREVRVTDHGQSIVTNDGREITVALDGLTTIALSDGEARFTVIQMPDEE